jgi:hypothetical protein
MWQQLHQWEDVNIKYPTQLYNKKIKSQLTLDGIKLKVIPPLGKTPSDTYFIDSDKII